MDISSDNKNESFDHKARSWETEILISGGACFSLYQLAQYIGSFLTGMDHHPLFKCSIAILVTGLGILSTYFAIHLTATAFWLSLILLQKIFPNGINKDNLKLAEPYQEKANQFNIEKRIVYLDHISGLIFAWSITFVLIVVGIGLATTLAMVPPFLLVQIYPGAAGRSLQLVVSIVYVTYILFLLDTFFYGFIRRSRFLAKVFYPLYLFWNTITLGFLWRPSLQTIFSNVRSRWKASLTVLVSTVFIIFLTGDESDYYKLFDSRKSVTEKYSLDETRYLDKRKNERVEGSCIQSDIITDNFLRVYVNYNRVDAYYLDSLKTKNKYFSELIRITINDSPCDSLTWVAINKENGQKGVQTIVDIKDLARRMHVLKIHRTYDKDPLVIPFWKQ
jgi:hypothetical protein